MDELDEGHGLALGVLIGVTVLGLAAAIVMGLLAALAIKPDLGAIMLCASALTIWQWRGERRRSGRSGGLAGDRPSVKRRPPSNDNGMRLASQPRYRQLRSR